MTVPTVTIAASDPCEKIIRTPMAVLTQFTTTLTQSGPCESTQNGEVFTFWAIDISTSLCKVVTDGGFGSVIDTWLRQPPSEMTSGTALASPLRVYWQSSDLSSFPSDYASSLASVIGVPFGDTSTKPTNTTTPPSAPPSTKSNRKSSSRSPGAIAGIAVGVGALVIASIVILLYLRRRRKRQRRLQHPDVPEMEGSSRGLKRFMGGKWRAETDGTSQPVEAGSGSVVIIPGPPVELDGTQRERDQ
ncbi:hypothetical protein BKA58DRAFT_390392 [Alternaria rosae]|uniref:uncharacterized protein n=1 Tax=Alternaria rosae TaxID=1187941 RepID=UPI001E8CAE33|nr:uncharacterized protein BKA58DRAFT_390392 [Alternaria rosae]KAH6865883.1 hypothetical protein BKA58DRAFT_390392 [Alternaria rosae]